MVRARRIAIGGGAADKWARYRIVNGVFVNGYPHIGALINMENDKAVNANFRFYRPALAGVNNYW